jgi:hypothetical protein
MKPHSRSDLLTAVTQTMIRMSCWRARAVLLFLGDIRYSNDSAVSCQTSINGHENIIQRSPWFHALAEIALEEC